MFRGLAASLVSKTAPILASQASRVMIPSSYRMIAEQARFLSQKVSETKTASYESLFKYIKKNTTLPPLIDAISLDDPKLATLHKAIQQGDFNHALFADAECDVYLLALMKHKKLSFNQGMTVYSYLTALMQFTAHQPVKLQDNDIQVKRDISMVGLVKDKQITQAGKHYIESLIENCHTTIDHDIDRDALTTFILQLPRSEQSLLRISFNPKKAAPQSTESIVDRLSKVIVMSVPLLTIDTVISSSAGYCVPSYSILQYLLGAVSKDAIQMQPVFGATSLATIQQLHKDGLHPIALYSKHVKSNLHNADGYRCGPAVIKFHDYLHTFGGSLLEAHERRFIFDEFVPTIQTILEHVKTYPKGYEIDELQSYLKVMIDSAIDFDLSNIQSFRNKNSRFTQYLARCCNQLRLGSLYASISPYETYDIGGIAEDHVYFLLWKAFYSKQSLSKEDKQVWLNLFNHIQTQQCHRDPDILKALQTLAQMATHVPRHLQISNPQAINWTLWLKRLDRADSSKEGLSSLLREGPFYDLPTLICNYQIPFFPPFLPMTKELANQLRALAERELHKAEEISIQPYSLNR